MIDEQRAIRKNKEFLSAWARQQKAGEIPRCVQKCRKSRVWFGSSSPADLTATMKPSRSTIALKAFVPCGLSNCHHLFHFPPLPAVPRSDRGSPSPLSSFLYLASIALPKIRYEILIVRPWDFDSSDKAEGRREKDRPSSLSYGLEILTNLINPLTQLAKA